MKYVLMLMLFCSTFVLAENPLRFTCPRAEAEPDIVYYFEKPLYRQSYPILIMCTGSTSEGELHSVMWMHEYFKEQIAELDVGVITVEQWGIDGNAMDDEVFFSHYCRSQRLKDHLSVIKYLEKHPPEGWNGGLLFLGCSEGGPLVTELSCLCPRTIATVNWVGAGDWSWEDELWAFFEKLKQTLGVARLEGIPETRIEYDLLVEQIKHNPSTIERFGGMTYFYHADAFRLPPHDYTKIYAPFLVITGSEDPMIESCDIFVKKALDAGAPIAYIRVEGMDHYIRHRPNLINYSFEWLKGLSRQFFPINSCAKDYKRISSEG